jgi:hypothetical protein
MGMFAIRGGGTGVGVARHLGLGYDTGDWVRNEWLTTNPAGNHNHTFGTNLTGGSQPHNHTAIPPAIMCTVALFAGA